MKRKHRKLSFIEGDVAGACVFLNEEPPMIGGDGVSRRMAKFRCICGAEFISNLYNVIWGRTYSCGCAKKGNLIHGGSINQVDSGYNSWLSIRLRCRDPKCKEYKNYGAKGKTMFDLWYDSYESFISYIGKRPSPQHTVDRFPNKNGNYEPGNVRWATYKQQSNNRNDNILVEYNGDTKTLAEWCAIYNIGYKSAHRRYHTEKWSLGDVIKRGVDNAKGIKYSGAKAGQRLKFTLSEAEKIRIRYSAGSTDYKTIAKDYNVNPMTIGKIIRSEIYV